MPAPVRRAIFWLPSALLMLLFVSACGGPTNTTSTSVPGSSKTLNVVAAENFYGDIVKQLGGSHVTVLSILSDPNADPHEYESNVQDARAVSTADLVIKNGDGYDDWMDKLLSGSPNGNRVVLNGSDIADHKLPDNPHVWYSLDNVRAISQAITNALKKLDGTDSLAFDSNLTTFKQSLVPIVQQINAIKAKYNGTAVGLTETIYLYQTTPMGLNVITPFEFEKAIAEGNDPPADTVATANNQVKQKQIKVLVYNEQTVTPITTNLQNAAKAQNIPIVPVTETMPTGKTYQSWMTDQLTNLQQALGG